MRPVLVEPSYIQEFREISSHYSIENKENSVDISSNGEFDKADKMSVYQEDDTVVLKIEQTKNWRKENNLHATDAPHSIINEATQMKLDG